MSIANFNNDDIDSGRFRPGLLTVEGLQRNVVFLDHKDAVVKKTENDFTVNIGPPLFRVRGVSVTRCITPKPNNLTIHNNYVVIIHDDGTVAFTMEPGLYSPTSFINEFIAKCNAALAALPSTDVFTGTYDAVTRRVTFVSTDGADWFFVGNGELSETFIVNGGNFAPFVSFSSTDVPGTVGAPSWESGICGFLYSRYMTVHSGALSAFEQTGSRTSDAQQPDNIVALVDLSNIYDKEDFEAGVNFGRNIRSVEIPDASYIAVANRAKSFNPNIDISSFDEFNFPYNDSFLDVADGFNGLGISLFMNFHF